MAQLVARLVRNEKVRGSNPLSSTHQNHLRLGMVLITIEHATGVIPSRPHVAYPGVPLPVQTVQSGPIRRGSKVCR